MNKNVCLLALAAGIGIADYFLLRKSRTEIIQDILKKAGSGSVSATTDFKAVLNKMTRQELQDVYALLIYSAFPMCTPVKTAVVLISGSHLSTLR